MSGKSAAESSTPVETLPADPPPASDEFAPPVLLVERDLALRRVLAIMLQEEGFRVATATDGQEALEEARRARPAVVLLDLGLSVLNGEGVAEGLTHLFAERPPIIVITGAADGEERSHRLGAVAYFAKPFDLEALAHAVRRAGQQG